MTMLFSGLGVTFVAFCIWLTVRIANRRERWAARMAYGLVAVLLAYPLSLGPAHLIECSIDHPYVYRLMHVAYRPLALICRRSELATRVAYRYADICGWRRPAIVSGGYAPPGFEFFDDVLEDWEDWNENAP